MRRIIPFVFVAAALSLAVMWHGSITALAQEGVRVADGIIAGVTANEAGELESFALLNAEGDIIEVEVRGGETPTQYGLESQAGDRWVSNQAENPVESAQRLRDHQQRFAPVTVRIENGIALSVVERESGRLETNLGFLFAVFAITWGAFFAYIFYVSRKQRDLQRDVTLLRNAMKRTAGQQNESRREP
ncbi:MAG: CcmD family protein [Dehalococcoidia bacterium]